MEKQARKNENRIGLFDDLIQPASVGDAPTPITPGWKTKTLPPNLSAVVLEDAANDPIITAWTDQRALECMPAIRYKALRFQATGRLAADLEDAVQDATEKAIARMRRNANHALLDNPLIGHFAVIKITERNQIRQNRADELSLFSLDERLANLSDGTERIEVLSAALVDYDIMRNRANHLDRPEILCALDNLSDVQSQTFQLNAVFGWTTKDIAAKTGIAHSTTRSHMKRAKTRLSATLAHLAPFVQDCPPFYVGRNHDDDPRTWDAIGDGQLPYGLHVKRLYPAYHDDDGSRVDDIPTTLTFDNWTPPATVAS